MTNISSKIQLDNEYLDKAESFGTQLSIYLNDYIEGGDDAINFENQLTDLANRTNLDANVYNISGEILASSQPLIVENYLVSGYINPTARQKILEGKNLDIQKETRG